MGSVATCGKYRQLGAHRDDIAGLAGDTEIRVPVTGAVISMVALSVITSTKG